MNIADVYVKPIEIYANKLDITLLETALNDLMEKAVASGDLYEITGNISNLITQIQLIKGE